LNYIIIASCFLLLMVIAGAVLNWSDSEEMGVKK
jgi:hypothetical protein